MTERIVFGTWICPTCGASDDPQVAARVWMDADGWQHVDAQPCRRCAPNLDE